MRGLVLVVLLVPSVAQAGWLSMRGGYYKERSTRVIQPMLDAEVDLGERDAVSAHVLVDSITSASAATGAAGDGFTENRKEGGLGWRHDFGLWRLAGAYRYSTENDYISHYGSARLEVDFAEKNTTLVVAAARGFDTISNGVNPGELGYTEYSLKAGLSSVSLRQVLSPRLVGSLTFDFTDEHGFLENIYRRVFGAAEPIAEQVPDLRLRGALAAGLRAYVAPTDSVVVGSYRFYADDWGVHAHTGEVSWIQAVAPGVSVRVRGRLHLQDAADFFQDVYTEADLAEAEYYAADDKLSAFHAEELGLGVAVHLRALGAAGWLGENRVDVTVDRVWQDNDFGDAWAAQLGLVVPLESP